MSEMTLLVDMVSKLQDTVDKLEDRFNTHSNEMTRINTTINIEMPDIKGKVADTKECLQTLEKQVGKIETSLSNIDQMVQSMKPVVQFFTFIKILSIGFVALLGWIGANASGLFDIIGKLFHK